MSAEFLSIEDTIVLNLIYNETYSRAISPYLERKYFESRELGIIYDEFDAFIKNYKELPSVNAIVHTIEERKDITDTDFKNICMKLKQFALNKDAINEDFSYLKDITLKHCQDRSIYLAVTESIAILNGDDDRPKTILPSLLEEALSVDFDNTIGHDYFGDAESRFEFYTSPQNKIKFRMPWFNDITSNGVTRKTLNVFMGGTGCHAKGTNIIMHDGSVKRVEDVIVGDTVMSPSKGERVVNKLHRGTDQMMLITPIKGEPFVVNKGHILNLYVTPRYKGKAPTYIDISVEEYLGKSAKFKHMAKLHRSMLDTKDAELEVDPWLLGVLLGDGSITRGITFTTGDVDIIDAVVDTIPELTVNRRWITRDNCYSVSITDKRVDKKTPNGLTTSMRKIGVMGCKSGDKFVPDIYKTAGYKQRLDVIAGLLDTDGSKYKNGGFDWVSKSEQLADDLVWLCRSVGLAAYKHSCVKGCQNSFTGTYYRVGISGECMIIPNRCSRKKVTEPRKQIKNVLVTGFSVEPIGQDDYYGFSLDGDRLYMTGDFVVHHNSGKTRLLCSMAADYILDGHNVLYITNEMAEEKIAERIDANMIDIDIGDIVSLPKDDFMRNISKISAKTNGRFYLKEYPTSSAHVGHFRHLLRELKMKKKFKPDIIFIDYLNICASSRIKGAENSYLLVKSIAEELRGLAIESDTIIWSATQSGRQANGDVSDVGLTDVSECLTLDTVVIKKDGSHVRIDSLAAGDKILGSQHFVTVQAIHHQKTKLVYEIVTKSGKRIKCSADHKFPTSNGRMSINTGLDIGSKVSIL